MKRISLLLIISLFVSQLNAQGTKLENGPMLGYSTLHEVMLWVQTTQEAKVQIVYYTDGQKEKHFSQSVLTEKKNAFAAHLLLDEITPATKYNYDVLIDGKKQKLAYETSFTTKQILPYRTDAPAFSFAASSGCYINEEAFDRPGNEYGGLYQIFETIKKQKPDFMIWGGDNVYLRQYEWESWTGVVHRYTHDRKTTEMQELLANVHHYAIVDDHDFGPNDSDGGFPFKDMTTRAFQTFWANPPKIAGLESSTSFFSWYDADFFMLDNRYYRSPNYLISDEKTQLGKKQLQWLKDALVFSKASFKFILIGGQFLNAYPSYESYTNYGFNKEREEIINFIYEQKVRNVVFITGDRHYTDLSILKKRGQPDIMDITLSPFTSGPNTHAMKEQNYLRVEGTTVMERNFGLLKLKGDRKHRKLEISVIGTEGNLIWKKEFDSKRK